MTRLTTLILNGCEQVKKEFLNHLVKKLPYVQTSKAHFGFEPLADAEQRIALTDLRRKQVRAARAVGAVVLFWSGALWL